MDDVGGMAEEVEARDEAADVEACSDGSLCSACSSSGSVGRPTQRMICHNVSL